MILKKAPASLSGQLALPLSKSLANRHLIIQALAGKLPAKRPPNLPDDVAVLWQALVNTSEKKELAAAGTAMRFMTAYCAMQKGNWQLSGIERAHERPIEPLVTALQKLGATIQYLEKAGYPPLSIKGTALQSKKLKIDGSISSQFVSALLLIAPYLPQGLRIEWDKKPVSYAYIQQTLACMQASGATFTVSDTGIDVKAGSYNQTINSTEADWSSAAYWLAFVCLLPGKILLKGLHLPTTQPDANALQLMQPLGLCWEVNEMGLLVWRDWEKSLPKSMRINLSDCPDLAPTMLVLCACLQVKVLVTGIDHLQYKESDRLKALQAELSKAGAMLSYDYRSAILAEGVEKPTKAVLSLETWQDHRIAMALSLLSAKGFQLTFDNPEVVSKSYPAFWEDLASFGFELT